MSTQVLQFLDHHNIDYEQHHHPPVFTCEEAAHHCPNLVDINTKNLFLRDRKGKRHFLVVTDHQTVTDLKALGEAIGVSKLSFGSPERLSRYLGVEPGSVTVLALVNDPEHEVELYIQEDVWEASRLACHPLVNTSTLVISKDGLKQFLSATGHQVNFFA